ncbi:MAG: glucose-6-phosphate isomerase [Alphaproteobacteria bacterium]|nr:glucose-6-phosphate isomerase [Alphaproteobacteria bacterium]
MPNRLLTEHAEFKALQAHRDSLRALHMKDLFAQDPQRAEKFSNGIPGLHIDYSRHRITGETMDLLMNLARACDVEGWRDKMFSGYPVNTTENRAALHVALRRSVRENLTVDGENITDYVDRVLDQMKKLCAGIRKPRKFSDIVNIGIGGSDLGTRMVHRAIQHYSDGPPYLHFVSNVDGAALAPLLKTLQPHKTLFVISSKTFTTMETLANAESARDWLSFHLGEKAIDDHFIAITESESKALALGIKPENILPLRDWIGGRMSIWSAIGLPIAASIGYKYFEELLRGGQAMDRHFCEAPLEKNLPVIMALLGIWYRNCWDMRAHAVLPYAEDLTMFTAWLQQLDMESNGKRVSRDGRELDYPTGPIIFGELGTDVQHAFFQLLHQGSDVIPCDFILVKKPEHALPEHHAKLHANALAQAQALMEGQADKERPWRAMPGNRPSSTLVLNELDPYHLGMLLALYEHKVFVQGILWNINSFDQWGVELGKTLAKDILQAVENKEKIKGFDSSVTGLLRILQAKS